MAAAALGLWILHTAVNLVARIVIHYRGTGRSGLVGVSGRLGAVELAAGLVQVAAIALGVAAPLLDLNGRVDPVDALDLDALRWAGLPLGLAAVAGVAVAQQGMGRSWRIGVDTAGSELVTAGPFRHVRHPIYSFLVLLHLAVALLVPNAAGIASLALAVLFVELQARAVEEPWLLREHGGAYAAYAARTGRFIPGVGRIRGG